MSEQLRESLSAAMDGEADAFELRRVLDEAAQDEALCEQWHRFHLMRDLLREPFQAYDPALRAAVQTALQSPQEMAVAQEEVVAGIGEPTAPAARSPWLARLGGTAVAAAVAVAVMINGGVFEDDAAVEFAHSEFAGPELVAVQPQMASAVAPMLYQQATDQDKQRQNALMLHHIQQRAMNQASMTSFVKMATFNSTSRGIATADRETPRQQP